MKITVWHNESLEDIEFEIDLLPPIGSYISLDSDDEFAKATGYWSFEVIKIELFISNNIKVKSQCIVTVKNYEK